MRNLVYGLVAVLAVSADLYAAGLEPPPPHATVQECASFSLIGGRSFVLLPTREELDESPVWSPFSEEEPPIPVGEAVRLATREFIEHFKDHDDWSLEGISLLPLCEGRWTWIFNWQPKRRGDVGSILLPVLMSGTVIPVDRLVLTGGKH